MNAMKMNHGYLCEVLCVEKEPNVKSTIIFELLKDTIESLQDECLNHEKSFGII